MADLAAVVAATVLAYATYELLQIGRQLHYSASVGLLAAFSFAVLFVLMLDHDGAYKRANSLLRIRETERILRVTVQAFAVVFLVTFFLSELFSRWVVVLAVVFVPLLVIVEKQVVFVLIRNLHSRGYGLRNALVYGAGLTGRRVFSAIVRSPKLGLNPVAIVDDNEKLAGNRVYGDGYKHERSARVIAGPLSSSLIREWGVSLVLIGIPSLSKKRFREIAGEALAAGANVAFVPQLSYSSETLTDYVDIDGVLIASLGLPVRDRMYETGKRIFDFGAALVLLVLTLPLWAVLALLIRLDSKGPAFFRQERVGRNGKRFDFYKFRSMRVDVPQYGLHPFGADDPRVTRFGRWLRRTSLDELPQLINVLKGDMSLVGPRPEMPFIVERYNARHRQRLQVIPGLTGLWQLSADRSFLIHENIQYDLYYIRHRNFFMDLAILLHTAVFAMKGM
ncbi:MAG: exopolysaccharide biosynthesis polyprenyl glycosylphosphotransferase [Terracidiphilus sp.]|jgi:exopolysaccharide biosynthesis polyprenyl glycosylphosphotransferase